jgi:hypothetical protein
MNALPTRADHPHRLGNSVVLDLLVSGSKPCTPCQDAIEEIDRAAALVAPELAARGTRLQVRVTTGIDTSTPAGPGPLPGLDLRINGIAIEPHDTDRGTDRSKTSCGTYEWDGETYAAPSAELLTATIHDHLDRV